MKKMIMLLTISFLLFGCASHHNKTVFQTSTIDALLLGVYDGQFTCQQLLEKGTQGIGTFNNLDGEMAVIDGVVYQIKSDGKVYQPANSIMTPFATVCNFCPEKEFGIKPDSDHLKVKKLIDELAPNQNLFCSIRLEGEFSYMKTRSVPAQKKPFPPLSEVTKNQPIFENKNVSGTVVGFRSPAFVKGINVPGYHWHFVSKDKTCGGHILAFTTTKVVAEVEMIDNYALKLPRKSKAFAEQDFSKDRSQELQKVEK